MNRTVNNVNSFNSLNNTESIKVNNSKKEQPKLLEKTMDIIKEKMKALMKEGDYLGWYRSESKLEKPDIAAVYNKHHEETNSFARIIG